MVEEVVSDVASSLEEIHLSGEPLSFAQPLHILIQYLDVRMS